MTRANVARRLGKSIATIRRMEGIELHPVKDGNGVNRFDAAEVEAILLTGSERLQTASSHRIGPIGSRQFIGGDEPCLEASSAVDPHLGEIFRIELVRLRQAQREIEDERIELRRLRDELRAKDRKRQLEADELGRLVLDALGS